MGNEFYHKLGAAFLFAAAIIYTVERLGQKLAGWLSARPVSSAIYLFPYLR